MWVPVVCMLLPFNSKDVPNAASGMAKEGGGGGGRFLSEIQKTTQKRRNNWSNSSSAYHTHHLLAISNAARMNCTR